MILITDNAAAELKGILAENTTDPDQVLRLDLDGDAISLGVGFGAEDDDVIQGEEGPLVHVSSELADILEPATMVIDCIDTPEGPQLTIYNASECSVDACDCGCHSHDHEEK